MRAAPANENTAGGRIGLKFARRRGSNQSALIPFIVAGDPDLDRTQRLVLELEARGADLIELGVPFSDPMADGPANQRAAARGLASGATLPAILALDRANDVRSALAAVARYSGAAQNLIVADRAGNVAYHVIGSVPNDGAWGRFVHPAADLRVPLRLVPFSELPHADPNPGNVVLSANNKMYAGDRALRLSAAFVAPYRAYRIAQLLHDRSRYDEAYFARMQLDDRSPMEAEFARAVATYARRVEALAFDADVPRARHRAGRHAVAPGQRHRRHGNPDRRQPGLQEQQRCLGHPLHCAVIVIDDACRPVPQPGGALDCGNSSPLSGAKKR